MQFFSGTVKINSVEFWRPPTNSQEYQIDNTLEKPLKHNANRWLCIIKGRFLMGNLTCQNMRGSPSSHLALPGINDFRLSYVSFPWYTISAFFLQKVLHFYSWMFATILKKVSNKHCNCVYLFR